jgi:hypothetical protein
MAETSGPGPVTLRVAVWLLAVEAALVGIFAVYLVVQSLTGGASSGRAAAGVIGFLLVVVAVLGAASWALNRRQAWARGPAIVLHFLLFPFGLIYLSEGQPLLGAVALLVGLGGSGVLLAPATRIAVGRG